MYLLKDESVLTSSIFLISALWGIFRHICSFFYLNSPGWEICSTQVNEKIPFPIQHGKEVLHAVEICLQKAGTAPDGHHPPGSGSNVGVLLGHLQHLPVHVSRTLQNKTGTSVIRSQM